MARSVPIETTSIAVFKVPIFYPISIACEGGKSTVNGQEELLSERNSCQQIRSTTRLCRNPEGAIERPEAFLDAGKT
jgi:hypothetical protein